MNRRRFLKRAGLVGLWTVLQACRLPIPVRFQQSPTPVTQLSTSIPTDTPTTSPTVDPTSTATASPTGTLPPTETPIPTLTPQPATPTLTSTPTAEITPTETLLPGGTPSSPVATPTATPTSTFTPTPTPTPYPPGPPSKLGLFVTQFEPRVLEMTATAKPALIKTLEIDSNFAKGLKDASPTSLVVGRVILGQQNLDIDPQPLIQAYIDKILPIATDPLRLEAFDGWEAYNEPVADTPDKMKRLADFEAERTRLLGEQGIRSVVGNFAAGHPPLELWPLFAPALDAIRQYNGFLGLHEYSAPLMQYRAGALQPEGDPDQGDEGWLTLRYRKAYRQHLIPMGFGDIPTLITECGVDGLIRPRPGPEEAKGWQDFIPMWKANGLRDDPPGVYMDQLIWYDENLQQDDYIQGAAIFLAGTNDPQWETYDILGNGSGRMSELLSQYLVVHPPR